jgi:hypothetical protein
MQSTFHPALKVFPSRAEKKPKEKKAAYIKLYRQKTAAATKATDPRMVPRSQHTVNDHTPDLLAKPSTSTSTSTENAQKIDEKMQQSFKPPNCSVKTRLTPLPIGCWISSKIFKTAIIARMRKNTELARID